MVSHSLPTQLATGQAVASTSSAPRLDRGLLVVGVIGLAIAALGWLLDREAAAGAWLVAANYGLGLGIGALAFLAISRVMGAGWHVAFRRIPEAMAGSLPLAAILMFLAILLALPVYEWNHSDVVAKDSLLQHKSAWLNVPGILIRAVICLAAWCVFAALMRRTSREQDKGDGEAKSSCLLVLSASFLAVFAITWAVASFDWIMSLEPHWFSTVYAIYTFSSALVSAIAVMIIAAILLERWAPMRGVVRTEHLHDLGKLLKGMCTFWAYIWFCQYMLIWYSNIPEETTYFLRRTTHGWTGFVLASLVLMWVVPFLGLLPRPAKRNRTHLMRIALAVLVGRWIDLHVLVIPGIAPKSPWSLGWEIPAVIGVVSLVLWASVRAFGSAPAVPTGDPYLMESQGYNA